MFADAKCLTLSKFQYVMCNPQSFGFSQEKCSINAKSIELVVAIHRIESIFLAKGKNIVTNQIGSLHMSSRAFLKDSF